MNIIVIRTKLTESEVQACCDLLTYLLQNSHYRINRLHITQLWKVTLPKYTDMWVAYLFIYSLTPNTFFEKLKHQEKEKHC